MRFDPDKYHRRSIRLQEYDYSQAGAYFVTLVAQNREPVFGRIANGIMELSDVGRMIHSEWQALLDRFPRIQMDEFVVMPNHFHAIVVIVGATLVVAPDPNVVAPDPNVVAPDPGAGTSPAPTLGDVIGAFKSITTNRYIQGVKESNWPPFDRRLWQRNYYEHILRDERDWDAIRSYIINNPLSWESDSENPYLSCDCPF